MDNFYKMMLMSGVALLAQPAFAQSSASGAETAQNASLGDIVVTAQRREQSVQKTALAIEVLSGNALEQRGVTQSTDLTRVTTGVQASSGGFNQIYIRGVGDVGASIGANPAVVTNLNGIPISRGQIISGNFFDLERIEVLKGPQGTLYGRNATGGVVNMIAVKPKLGQLGGFASATIGNYGTQAGEGAINVPVGASAAVRLSGQVSDRSGYLKDGSDDDKHQSVRLQTLVESGALTAQLRASYVHLGGVGAGSTPSTTPGLSAWTGGGSKGASDYYIALADANSVASHGASPPSFLLARTDGYKLFQDTNSLAVDGQFDYDLDGATITVIPAYRKSHIRYGIVPSYLYTSGGTSSGTSTDGERSTNRSIEARIGNNGAKLKWVAGLFAFKEDQSTDFIVDSGLIQRLHISSDLDTKSIAFFGEGTYSVSDAFRLTAGARYTSEKRSSSNLTYAGISPTVIGNCLPPAFAPGVNCSIIPATSFDSSKTFKRTTWRVGVEVDLAEQNMLFANIATGFKAGGFNQAIDPTNPSQVLPFNPEKITAYTVGLRNRFADNKIQLNVEGFYWDYKGLQLSQVIIDGAGNMALATQNAGAARIYGMNVDFTARPFRNTTFRAAVEYLNAEYKDYTFVQAAAFTPPGSTGCAVSPSNITPGPVGPFVEVNCSGRTLARAPKWSGNVSISQVFDLSNGGNFTFDGDLSFASKREVTSNSFTPESRAPSYSNLSASLTYNEPNGKWSIGGYVRNITNTIAFLGGGEQSAFVPQYISTSILPPRTYGVRAKVGF